MKFKSLFLTVFLMVFVMVIISCGSKTTDSGNAIYVNVGPEPKTIDPTLNSTVDGAVYILHAFEGLARLDKNNKIAPGVAESWDISDDGLTYTFHLRTNALWADGEPLTANDFVYSWRRGVDPLTASEYGYQFYSIKNAEAILNGEMPIDSLGVKAIDDRTLEVKLETPTAYFLELVAFMTYYPLREDIVSANPDGWTLSTDTYIGNGPLVMTERKIDNRIVMEKNTNYWNADEVVAEKVVFILMENATAAVAGVKEGSLHIAKSPPAQDIPILKEEGLMNIVPYIGTYYYTINVTNGIMQDPKVRRALALAIDRTYIVEQVAKGGQVPAAAWVPSGISDINGDFRENGGNYFSVDPADYEKNLVEARALLVSAGYSNGENLPVIEYKTNPGEHVAIFEAIQQMWKEGLNIDSTISQEEWAVFQDTRQNKQYLIARHGWIGDYNDPMTFLDVFMSTSQQNNSGWSNAQYDALITEAKLTGNQNIRMKAMHDAENILMGEMALLPIYFYTEPLVLTPKLKDVVFSPLGMHNFIYSYIEE